MDVPADRAASDTAMTFERSSTQRETWAPKRGTQEGMSPEACLFHLSRGRSPCSAPALCHKRPKAGHGWRMTCRVEGGPTPCWTASCERVGDEGRELGHLRQPGPRAVGSC